MGSGNSRVNMIDSNWWEAQAQQILVTTTKTGKVEVICSLIPFEDERIVLGLLKARSDLDTLFTLHYRGQKIPGERDADYSNEFKANELWRVLRSPSAYRAPWDHNWQPPLLGNPDQIADQFHVAVCRAVFQVPPLDFVKCALGYNSKAFSADSLLNTACEVRNSLQRAFQDRPETKDTYINVEKILQRRYHPLAYWIVASSLHNITYAPYDALTSNLDPIKNVFATRDLDLVLKRLAVFDRCFTQINQKYDWDNWSTDLDLWECVNEAMWSGHLAVPSMRHLPPEGRDERLRFLQGFESAHEDAVGGAWRKVRSFVKRFRRGRQQSASDHKQHHGIEQRMQVPRISKSEGDSEIAH